ncbi:MAG: hypothetical protein J0G94_18690 [Sphingomonadales bacterium]|nr:hypothetical protein [Sphingomonadales bacterium]
MTIVLFVVPVLASILYNFVIATPRYASETSFVVRTGSQSSNRFSLPGIIQTPGQDDSEAIVSFIESRSLLSAIDRDGSARAIFAARGVDMFNRFPSLFASSNNESFYRHFGKYVRADFDRATSITTVEVQAFSAKDAHDLARRIVSESEGLVNRLSQRARGGSVESAQRDVREASAHLNDVLSRLNHLRDERRVIEPELQAGAAIKLSSSTEDRLAQLNVEIMQAATSAPQSPLLNQLRTRRAATERELARQGGELVGGPTALASRMKDIEELSAEREIAEKRLLAASLSLVAARRSADRQQIYVERISAPNLPDEPRYPRVWRNLGFTLLICSALLWIMLSLAELVVGDE